MQRFYGGCFTALDGDQILQRAMLEIMQPDNECSMNIKITLFLGLSEVFKILLRVSFSR